MVTRVHVSKLLPRLMAWMAALVLSVCMQATAAEVEAQLDRDSVPAGNGALLTIIVSGGRPAEPVIPVVEDLIVQPRGQSQQMQIVNGRTSSSVRYSYAVGSNTPGDYRIPAIKITVDGKEYSTQPLDLKVLDSAAAQPPAGMPPATAPGGEGAADTDEKRFGFLTVELAGSDRKHAYVGEIAPVRIRAWIPADSRANLRSGIQPEAKGFTLHNVSNRPQQTEEMRDGKRYIVVTWFGGISATKAGKYPASLSVNATVAVRDPNALKPPQRRGGPFDDPFFNGIFEDMNVPMIEKDVTLKSDDQEIEVRPLPKEGRPDGFKGAVGSFKFDATEMPSQWKTGEPQQVRTRLSGSGNFTLMKAPGLTPAEAWKTYPGKDEFSPGDEASFSGSKVFQFSAVPRKGGKQETSLEFSYFDPALGEYKTINSPVKAIDVAGQDIVEDEPVTEAAPQEPAKKEGELVPQHEEYSAKASLLPLVSRPTFFQLLGSGVSLGVVGAVIGFLRIRTNNPERIARAAVEKATHAALADARKSADLGNVAGFFAAGRLAIQHRLGVMWNQPARAITLADIDARISGDSPVARFFAEADRNAYSPQSDGGSLPQWKTLLDAAMKSLTPSSK